MVPTPRSATSLTETIASGLAGELDFDGSDEGNGMFDITGGDGNDTIIGGDNDDTIDSLADYVTIIAIPRIVTVPDVRNLKQAVAESVIAYMTASCEDHQEFAGVFKVVMETRAAAAS